MARLSANHIHRTDILRRIYKIGWSESYQPIISLIQLLNLYIMVILWRIYKIRWSESYRPIISLGHLFNRYKRSQSSEASSRSDGQTLKPKSLMRKSRTITSAIKSPRAHKSLTRKAVLCTHKSLRALNSVPRKIRTITSAISRLRAKVGISRPQ